MSQKLYLIVLGFTAIIIFDSCSNTIEPEVRYTGALRKMMFGDLQATASLDSLEQKANLYAIGAIENLKGEIQIFDGQPLNSSIYSGRIALDSTFEKKAALLVYAQVANWQNIEIPVHINSSAKLEKFIEQKAKDIALDIAEPFPFLITGNVKVLKWHVINWKEGDTVHTHQKHKKAGASGKLENNDVEIIGFYSKFHQAVFTHHSTLMHMHFKSKDEKLAGHIDELLVGNSMVLKLPKK